MRQLVQPQHKLNFNDTWSQQEAEHIRPVTIVSQLTTGDDDAIFDELDYRRETNKVRMVRFEREQPQYMQHEYEWEWNHARYLEKLQKGKHEDEAGSSLMPIKIEEEYDIVEWDKIDKRSRRKNLMATMSSSLTVVV